MDLISPTPLLLLAPARQVHAQCPVQLVDDVGVGDGTAAVVVYREGGWVGGLVRERAEMD